MPSKYIIYIGPHTLDFTSLQTKLVDFEDGGTQGLRPDMPGFASVVLALGEAMPLHGAAAGIPQDVYEHFVMCNETIDTIDERITVAAKQLKVLKESRAYYVDARQNDIGLMVDAMRSRAQRRKDTSILIPFGEVIQYNGQIGEKANRTRKKNEQAAAEAAAETETEAETATEATPAAPAAAPQPA